MQFASGANTLPAPPRYRALLFTRDLVMQTMEMMSEGKQPQFSVK